MDTISSLTIVVCGYSCLIGAMILTTYEKSSTVRVSGLASCVVNTNSFDYCTARVTNNTCNPLNRNWCGTKDMSDEGVYITKKTITEILKATRVHDYDRKIPIYLSEGSELELRFRLHYGWITYGIDLEDDSGNTVLHTKFRLSDNAFFFSTWDINGWGNAEGFFSNTFPISDGVNYTLKIVCATSGFQIYLDGTHEWTFAYIQPAYTISFIYSQFHGAHGDLYQVTYKAGP